MCESAGTRLFAHGRTDFIRNTTSEALAFIETMQDSNASVSGRTGAKAKPSSCMCAGKLSLMQ
jgi:hypothetical protein